MTRKKSVVDSDDRQTIEELLGWALGVGRLRFEDFCLLTPFEFQKVVDAISLHDDNQERGAWERARIIGCLNLAPWSKGGVKQEGERPWRRAKKDSALKGTAQNHGHVETKEEAKENLEKLLKRVKLE